MSTTNQVVNSPEVSSAFSPAASREPSTDEYEDDDSMLPVDEPLVTALYDLLSDTEGVTIIEVLAGIKRSLDRLTKVGQKFADVLASPAFNRPQ